MLEWRQVLLWVCGAMQVGQLSCGRSLLCYMLPGVHLLRLPFAIGSPLRSVALCFCRKQIGSSERWPNISLQKPDSCSRGLPIRVLHLLEPWAVYKQCPHKNKKEGLGYCSCCKFHIAAKQPHRRLWYRWLQLLSSPTVNVTKGWNTDHSSPVLSSLPTYTVGGRK